MNFFQKAKDDVDKLEQELLGPDYKYFKQVSKLRLPLSASNAKQCPDNYAKDMRPAKCN